MKQTESTSSILARISKNLSAAAVTPNIYGYIPHERQIKFHSADARIRLFIGGNRSGKTVGGATEAVWWLTGRHPFRRTPPPPVRGRCISVDFLNGVEKIVRPEISKWVPPSELLGGSWSTAYSRELRTLRFENGSTLEFMSYDQELDKFAGTSRHFIWFDEEPPEEVYKENLMRLIDVGGHLWITMTPVEGMTWVFDTIYEKRNIDPNVFVVEVDMTQNPHLQINEIDAFVSGLSEDDRKARVQGKFVALGGLIYSNFNHLNVVDPIDPDSIKKELWVAGMDSGLNNPAAWLWGSISTSGRVLIFREHYKAEHTIDYHAGVVHRINAEHGKLPAYNVGDPAIAQRNPVTGTSVQQEYIEHGIPILRGNNDVSAGIARVRRLMGGNNLRSPEEGGPSTALSERKLLVTSDCVNLIKEISRYRWARWATKKMSADRNRKEEPLKKDDHAVDALRYLIASRPEAEDGSSIPPGHIPGVESASIAISATDYKDDDLSRKSSGKHADYSEVVHNTLGGEW